MTIVKNVMDKLSASQMDKLTVCNNYLYSHGLPLSMWISYLTYDVCFVSKDICLGCACLSKWKQ
jgi:hypothetical protein